VPLGQIAFRPRGSVAQRHLQHLREVHRLAVGGLRDLLAAAEAVGDD
jgi:hypothetical protein